MGLSIFERRVAAGAVFLDKHHPGWEQKINLRTLNIQCGTSCILGQLYGKFSKAILPLGIVEPVNSVRLGFMVYEPGVTVTSRVQLKTAWKRLITDRMAEQAKRGYNCMGDITNGDGHVVDLTLKLNAEFGGPYPRADISDPAPDDPIATDPAEPKLPVKEEEEGELISA